MAFKHWIRFLPTIDSTSTAYVENQDSLGKIASKLESIEETMTILHNMRQQCEKEAGMLAKDYYSMNEVTRAFRLARENRDHEQGLVK